MLVEFVMRSDLEYKAGGDVSQVREYAQHLARSGIESRMVAFRPGMRFATDAIVHIVNIDRPYDFLLALEAARGHRVVVSPIHHDLQAVRRMRLGSSGEGVRTWIGRILPESGRELLAFAARSFKHAEGNSERLAVVLAVVRASQWLFDVWPRIGRQLSRVQTVTLLAEGEGDSLRRDTGWLGLNGATIPNGVPARPEGAGQVLEWSSRDISLIVVGRIEPRKRQLELAKEAGDMAIPVVFVGPLTNPQSAYSSEFKSVIDSFQSLSWFGSADRDEVLDLLARSRVLVNASWVEVQSLVDIEAASQGCYVVSSDSGNSREWLGDSVTIVQGGDPRTALEVALALSRLHIGPVGCGYERTWQECAGDLMRVYTTADQR